MRHILLLHEQVFFLLTLPTVRTGVSRDLWHCFHSKHSNFNNTFVTWHLYALKIYIEGDRNVWKWRQFHALWNLFFTCVSVFILIWSDWKCEEMEGVCMWTIYCSVSLCYCINKWTPLSGPPKNLTDLSYLMAVLSSGDSRSWCENNTNLFTHYNSHTKWIVFMVQARFTLTR